MPANLTHDLTSANGQMPARQSIKPLLAQFAIDAPDIGVDGLILDSREVAIHKIFVALKGHQRDGRDFIPQAISLGAKVILAQCDSQDEHGRVEMREQSLIISFYQLPGKLSALAAAFYGYPANQLQIIGVTGTNGKTSTVQLSSQLAALCGLRAATIGTLGSGIVEPNSTQVTLNKTINTTPDAISMHQLIGQFALGQVVQVALEVSSHALVQKRIEALKIDVAVFTNLSRDHLDYHGSMQAYAQAKRQLLNQQGLKYVVLNANDRESENWLQAIPDRVTAVLFGVDQCIASLLDKQQYCFAEHIEYLSDGCRFNLVSSWGKCEIQLSLLGLFNVFNALAAITTQLCLGIPLAQLATMVSQLRPVTGRMERFGNTNQAGVVVDYAHTPDALKQALSALRAHCQGQLWVVFGCGGDRDKGKRSLMGEIAENMADNIIITNDNSRSEDPQCIANDILSGCRDPQRILIELDRRQAIQRAVEQAKNGDLILVAGKGHEDYQVIGDQTLAYDERLYVKNLFERNLP
ncbi:MAG: UDP-N-acetylmuramoyl-L-alanyl-D-glutamate--2,6-diaminopimelate ligase [Paraglaciecola sp.]|jgi:UDP-N-acetylmuramoyl-L-alanyl-D-glutamate--2,6-diaminopimelate ligase